MGAFYEVGSLRAGIPTDTSLDFELILAVYQTHFACIDFSCVLRAYMNILPGNEEQEPSW